MDTSSSAHGTGSAASSSSSQNSNRWKYDVFLSFRGEDTRNTFTDHLLIALRNARINTFIDIHLRRGAHIPSELDKTIEGSRITVIVFSKRYAESRWCLRELSKIMRCLKDQEGKRVCPIFYDVDPSQVRKQKDSFGEAFQKHEKDEDPNEVKQWREDLKASADLSGWNLKTTADGREGVFIETIVEGLKELLKTTDLKEAKHSAGMTFHVLEFSPEYLDAEDSPDVQIIGIRGTGGISKTISEMSKVELKDCHKLKDIPNLENSLDHICSILMNTSLADTFKSNLRTKNAFGGIFLSGNDIPNSLAYVAGEDDTVKFEVPPSIDYTGGLALGIVYSLDNSDSAGSLCINVVNCTQRTKFRVGPVKATVTASHEYYLWLGNLSNKKLNLKGGDEVLVNAEFYGGDKTGVDMVDKTEVDMVKRDLSDGPANWDNCKTIMPYKSNEDTNDDPQLDIDHVFFCYKTHDAWPWCINGSESDPLPKFFTSALKARENDTTFKMSMTVIEGREGTEFSDGDVLIFPQMIKYSGLKKSNVDSFVDDVLVNHKPWASGVRKPLTGPYVFICANMSQGASYRSIAPAFIDKFKQEAELRGLTDHVFVTAYFHLRGQTYAGNLNIYSISSDGSIKSAWEPFATAGDVPELLDKHIGKGEIVGRHGRGKIGASSDEAEEINDRELPNGEENKKIEDKPQENSNQIHQEKGNQIESSENGESEEKQLKETGESKS